MRSMIHAVLNKTKAGSIAVAAAAALVLTGCGGGDSGTAATGSSGTVTGKFVDATVVGLGYKCGASTALSGTTTATGQFTCNTGEAVAFYVGGIKLGSVASAQAVVTPLDLVGAGATPSHPRVINIVRFLMSISSTAAANGILTIDSSVVTAAAASTIDFTQDVPSNLDSVINTVKPAGATVATGAEATTHMSSSIKGLFAGSFSGSFGGSLNGTWSITIDSRGAVTGTATDSTNATFPVTGSMATTMGTGSIYAFNGTGGGTTWTGTLNMNTREFKGTWNDGAGASGTFTAKTATTPPAAVGTVTPTVSSFTATGAAGASVTITGANLTAVTQVLFTGPSPATTFVEGAATAKTASSITATVPATLVAGSYTLTVVHPGGEVTVGAFTVPGTSGGGSGGGASSGITISPDFNGMATFANRVPTATSAEAGQTSLLWNEGSPTLRRIALTHDAATKAGNTTGGELIFVQVVNFSSAISLNTGVSGALQCAQGATSGSSPTCASVGIAFNKTAGTVTFTNMPLTAAVLSSGATTTRTMSGSLTFAPF